MDPDYSAEDAIELWDYNADAVADAYGPEGESNREVVLNPALLPMLGEVEGRRVLDAGCGEGYLSRMLARRGARVVAVDYSAKLLETARQRTPAELSVEYIHANCEDLHVLKDDSFDLIVSNVVLQDLPDLAAAVAELFRVLRPGCFAALAITHPVFAAPVYGWVRDEQGRKLYWKVDRYFSEGPLEQAYPSGSDRPVLLFHRTLTTYFNTLTEAGFAVERLLEPTPDEGKLEKYPGFIDDFRMAHFLIFKVRKGG